MPQNGERPLLPAQLLNDPFQFDDKDDVIVGRAGGQVRAEAVPGKVNRHNVVVFRQLGDQRIKGAAVVLPAMQR